MNNRSKLALALVALAGASQACADVTLYEHVNFGGQSYTTTRQVADLTRVGFNDRASSVVIARDNWEVCDDAGFGGRCVVLRPGNYPNLRALGLNDSISSLRMATVGPVPSAGRVTFYEDEGFRGRSFSTDEPVDNFSRIGFNDRASSIVVERGPWQVCENNGFSGRCVLLPEGRYATLTEMGLNDRISSLRMSEAKSQTPPVADPGYRPAPGVNYGRRNNERLYEANVTDVRAVLATAGQRCWVERGQVTQQHGEANLPGAVLGGVIGHQIGGGFGKDMATIGGVAAGAAVGAHVGRDRDGQPVATQDVQRCESVPGQARTDYWDVTYSFRGRDHRLQMTRPPGQTITVNRDGEPRF